MTGDGMDEMARQSVEFDAHDGTMGMHGDADLHAGGMSGMGGMGSMMDMADGVGTVFLALLLLLLVGAAVLAIYLVRRPVSSRARDASPALAELDRRYARGEVDREMFLQIRRDLQDART